MGFNPEPSHRHGSVSKTAIVLANLGTPDVPTPAAVKVYLKQFLSDPRIVEIPRLIWWVILNGIILTFRPKRSGEAYAKIWNRAANESPLKTITRAQAEGVAKAFAADPKVIVDWAMR